MASNFEKRSRHGVAIAAILLLGSFAYSNTLTAPFVFDDVPNIERNEQIRIDSFSPVQLWKASFESPIPGRPLAFLTFAINYGVGGDNPYSFHVTNIAIHLLTGLVVYWLSLKILERAQKTKDFFAPKLDEPMRWYAATVASLVFTLHPIQSQSVTYIVQRMNSLAALLYLVAFACYLSGRDAVPPRRRWLLWSAGFAVWLFSLASKQITVTLPVVILLYEWYFYQNLSLSWVRRGAAWGISALLLLAIISVVQLLIVGEVFSHYEVRDFTMSERLLTQARVVCIYMGLTFWPLPSRLNLLHDVATSKNLTEPMTTLFALLGIATYLLVTVLVARRSRLTSFCLIWPVIHLAVESSVLPLEMIYEHRMYLPLFGIALLVGTILTYLLPRQAHWRRFVIAGALALSLTLATRIRNEVWRDPIVLWTDVVTKSPILARAYLNRGGAHVARAEWPEAIEDFNKAMGLRPDDQALVGRGMALFNAGRIDEAIEDFSRSADAALTPELRALALRNRGTAYSAKGDVENSIVDFSAAIEVLPGDVSSRFNRANAYRRTGEYRRAIADYGICVQLSPTYIQAYNNLAALLAECPDTSLRNPQLAVEHATRANELSEWKNWQLLDTLASAFNAAGEFSDAAKWQLRAIELAPIDKRNELRIRLDEYLAKSRQGRPKP